MENKQILNMDIDEFEENLDDNKRKEFKILDEGLADWAVEKIKEEKARFTLFENATKSKISLLNENLAEEKQRSTTRNSFLLFKLNEYLETAPCKITKTKMSLKLPSGSIIRKLPKLEFESKCGEKELKNDKNLINWCKENAQDMIKIDESVTWSELKKDLDTILEPIVLETGEIVDNEIKVIRKSTGEFIDCIGIAQTTMSIDVE